MHVGSVHSLIDSRRCSHIPTMTNVDPEELEGIEVLLFLMLGLFIGAFCRVIINKLPFEFPYTVVLFILGFLWGAIPNDEAGSLGLSAGFTSMIGPRFFLNVFLPSLIFYGAFEMKWYMFRSSLSQILLLAIPGVVISTSLTALVTKGMLESDFSWSESFLLGAILSATDPVAVVALMRKSHAPLQIVTVLEGESLVNDGTAMVVFEICLYAVREGSIGGGHIVEQFVRLSFGAVALGSAWGFVIIWILGRINADAMVEIMLCFASSYLLFYTAEYECEFSGILSVVVYGMCFPAFGKTRFSPGMGKIVEDFLSIMCYMSETLVFVIAGVLVYKRVDFGELEGADYGRAILLWVMLMIIRLFMLGVLSPLLYRTRGGFDPQRAVIFTWGGLRGAVALALALDIHTEHEVRDDVGEKMLFYTAAVTVLTLIINAPLSSPLLKRLSRSRSADEIEAEHEMFKSGLAALDTQSTRKCNELKGSGKLSDSAVDNVSKFVCQSSMPGLRRRQSRASLEGPLTFDRSAMTLKEGRLLFLRAVKKDYEHQVENGLLRWSAAQTLTYVADALEDAVSRAGTAGNSAYESVSRLHYTTDDVPMDSLAANAAVSVDVIRYLQNPAYLNLMRKYFTKWPFTWIFERVSTYELGNTVNALDGLMHAYESGMNVVREQFVTDQADLIVAEAQGTWNDAQKLLDKIEKKYSKQLVQIRSSAVAMQVLAYQLEILEGQSTAFTLEACEKLKAAIYAKQHRVIHNRVDFGGSAAATYSNAVTIVMPMETVGTPEPNVSGDSYLEVESELKTLSPKRNSML